MTFRLRSWLVAGVALVAVVVVAPQADAAPSGFKVMKTPKTGGVDVQFRSIAASDSSDAWIVGSYFPTSESPLTGLAEHWDGEKWSIVTLPLPAGTTRSAFDGVTTSSPGNVWVVGTYGTPAKPHDMERFIDHWDGVSWTIDPFAVARHGAYTLLATTGVDDLWLASSVAGCREELRQWDGTTSTVRWRNHGCDVLSSGVEPSPGQVWAGGNEKVTDTTTPVLAPLAVCRGTGCPASTGTLTDDGSAKFQAAAGTAGDVWMVGAQQAADDAGNATGPAQLFAYQWVAGIPTNQSPTRTYATSHVFLGVAVLPSGDAWAVGYLIQGECCADHAVMMSHTAAGWQTLHTPVPQPRTNRYSALQQIVNVPGTSDGMWAIGAAGAEAGVLATPYLLYHPDDGQRQVRDRARHG